MALELNGTTGVNLVQDGSVSAADLASTLDLSSKTITLPAANEAAMQLLSTTTIDSVTRSFIFDMEPATYLYKKFILEGVAPTTNITALWMRVGYAADNIQVGGEYDNITWSGSPPSQVAYWLLADPVGSDIDESCTAEIEAYNFGGPTYAYAGPCIKGMSIFSSDTTIPSTDFFYGRMDGADRGLETFTHVEFLWENPSTNNFQARGKIYEYGVKRS